ncbi:hypothetical protein PT974_02917 [Cladobotryum mycophilum]|uniref:Uncharacterized protein n=1 Tax=Cladobotryum mycophilum TaxID=491253 RepID=A0ABR0T0I9_9HYPO
MSRYDKDLLPIPLIPPQKANHGIARSLPQKGSLQQKLDISGVTWKQQISKLQKQNQRLQQTLVERDEKIVQLQKKITEYQQYIKKQTENFVQITRAVRSAFENYRDRAVAMPEESLEVSPTDEIIQAYAAFSDSDEDFFKPPGSGRAQTSHAHS